MRRKFLYLLIAILAFEFGALAFIKLNEKTEVELPKVETENVFEVKNNPFSENNKTKQPQFFEIKLRDLPCEDEILQIVWNDLTDETASMNVERAEGIKSCSDMIEIAPADKPTDLNGDGKEEIVIRGYENPFSRCGNNCYTYWIFQQIDNKVYRKLFESEGYLPVVKNKKTKGYKDIMFEFYASYNSFTNGFYQFDGRKYVLKRCWFEGNLYKNKDGGMYEGEKWKTENFDCKELWINQQTENLDKKS